MHKHIAFLRAINVGGHNVKMDVLREHFAALGFSGIETMLASGNVIFESSDTDRNQLEDSIGEYLQGQLGYAVATFIRSPAEVAEIVAYQPFAAAEMAAAGAFSVALLAVPPGKKAELLLAELETDIDQFHINGSEVYWMCTRKQSESSFSNTVFEKKLGIVATFRGIKTMSRLSAKYA